MAKKIILGILGVLALAIVVVLALAATQPDHFHFERSRDLAAQRSQVSPLVTDLRNWERWSPWKDLDPNQRVTYGPTTQGVGASYEWAGNDQVGRGRMEIVGVDERPDRTVVDYRLQFLEPFEDEADVEVALLDQPSGKTRATWSMDSDASFMEKIMCVFVDMDAMIGRDFEKGLERMERAAASN
jgi:hypothetical protein